jgi:hypothetical protein
MSEQAITCVMFQHENGVSENRYVVGHSGITKIEEIELPGLHCDIPHIRVWQGEEKVAEFCRHAIIGVWFEHSPPPADSSMIPW